jgi:hypothetical protein
VKSETILDRSRANLLKRMQWFDGKLMRCQYRAGQHVAVVAPWLPRKYKVTLPYSQRLVAPQAALYDHLFIKYPIIDFKPKART